MIAYIEIPKGFTAGPQLTTAGVLPELCIDARFGSGGKYEYTIHNKAVETGKEEGNRV